MQLTCALTFIVLAGMVSAASAQSSNPEKDFFPMPAAPATAKASQPAVVTPPANPAPAPSPEPAADTSKAAPQPVVAGPAVNDAPPVVRPDADVGPSNVVAPMANPVPADLPSANGNPPASAAPAVVGAEDAVPVPPSVTGSGDAAAAGGSTSSTPGATSSTEEQRATTAPTAPDAAPAKVDNAAAAPEPPMAPAMAEIAATPMPRYTSVWERIRAGFKMPEMSDALVRKWENFYAARPEYWQRINERGRRYLYFITAEIERRGMPLEIALLPIIESAYNPEALSRARASGIWQFIPATGKLYGLQQNWWLDDRRDVSAATSGALDYLQKLHDMFGDWQLALASYNWGEGAVQRAMNRNRAKQKPTDYASLKIPTETRNYLPKLQAVKNLIMAPEKYGLSLPDVPDTPYFTTVTTGRQIDVALAARLAGMPLEDFRILNPAHNRPVMAGVGEQRINLPSDKADAFVANLDAYKLPLVSWRPYQLKIGEKLEQVAQRFGIDVQELKRVNGLSGRRKLAPGHTLLVPGAPGDALASPIQTALFKEAPREGPGWHRVRRGETLAGIARRYDMTPADLRKLNGLRDDAVAPGGRLRLNEGAVGNSGKSKAGKRSKKKTVTPTRRR